MCAFVQVSEISLADYFSGCGNIVDCRLCVDYKSRDGRFGFIEFKNADSVPKVRLSLLS